jgi:response regulator RpfG family c-di-GMP phosphodiesterase
VKRVAEISKLLALKSGLAREDAEKLKSASPLHDLGKIGIPDSILHKPGKLSEEEWEIMKNHVAIGYDMLKCSQRSVLQCSAIIARDHHEHWDGNGYPRGAREDDIHLLGRITAVADVFDALASRRCHKEPWPLGRIVDYFKSQSGKQFDPALVAILLNNLESVLDIVERYKDDRSNPADMRAELSSL